MPIAVASTLVSLTPSKVLKILLALPLWLAGASFACADSVGETGRSLGQGWPERLAPLVAQIDEEFSGELGFYLRDLDSGEYFSLRAQEQWYLASMVKLPVALALLDMVDRGEASLDERMTLNASDYVDGAGETNWHGPGTRLRLGWLLEQMIIRSDNTATDMLIRRIGIERVNARRAELVAHGFGEITTLADVRRRAYAEFHPGASSLSGRDFIEIRREQDESARLARIAERIGVARDSFAVNDLSSAFEAYYATGANSGRLDAHALLLERLQRLEALSTPSTVHLLGVMSRVVTGEHRLKAGWPDSVGFAHKTGTQRGRFCDGGIASRTVGESTRRLVVVACTRGSLSLADAERAMRELGAAAWRAGAFD